MIYNFYPYTIDIDTKHIIDFPHDITILDKDKSSLPQFKSILTDEQMSFFKKLGVDINKLGIDYHSYNNIEIFETHFLLRGKFISLPELQVKTYLNIEYFGKEILNDINVISLSENDMNKNRIGNMQYSFKHPIIYSNKQIYQKWNCGYICCVIILKNYK
ncbi:MAG: hypothetical protein PUC39_10805 [Lachnospiraceae bacterium]|nr:hypothetical protein [Lachnospiraceae bacterium]